MSKTKLTSLQLVHDLTKMDHNLGEWAKQLIEEKGMTVDEVLEAMQRMVVYLETNHH